MTLWPWKRPIRPPHLLTTKTKPIKKNPQVTLPPTLTQPQSGRETNGFRGLLQSCQSRNKAQHLHTWFNARAHRNNPRPQQFQHTFLVLTPELWGLQQLPWSPSTPCTNVTGEEFCYSLVHTGQKIHLLGFALDLNTDCGWKDRSSSSRALHWDHSSNIPPGTAFLWQSSNWTGNCTASEPRGNSYSDF